MSQYYSPRPALISNPSQGIVFNYPNKAATTVINTASTIFKTTDPVLFSPLTDGVFEKVRPSDFQIVFEFWTVEALHY